MEFRSRQFLLDHVRSILNFYEPTVVDPAGGFFQNFYDDGSIFAPGNRHLVSSARMVVNYCRACQLFGDQSYRNLAQHGLNFLREYHWDETRQGYNWALTAGVPQDQTNHCYGLAFVLLASAAAHKIGLPSARDDLQRAWQIMESRFWDDRAGLYADEASADWSRLAAYRGQNANMHACEALIEAFEATGQEEFRARAQTLARRLAVDLAAKSDGLVWEHYTTSLDIDWDYNKDDPANLYRPWGFQPGHQTEWAKLLLTLYAIHPEDWMLRRAQELFDRALSTAWDTERGGIFYGFAPDGTICDSDKYFWVQAESIAASARLYMQTGDPQYGEWYDRIWRYAWDCLVDHEFGAWYRVLDADNRKLSNEKSTAGGKCDYHTIGAVWDVLQLRI